MTAKEWLLRARNIDAEIRELLREQEAAFSRATSAAQVSDGERVQTSNGNTTERKFVNYAAYSELIDKRIDELYAVKHEILGVINRVEDSTLRALLIARYISFNTWERIADDLHYSYVHVVHNLHPKALMAVEGILNEH